MKWLPFATTGASGNRVETVPSVLVCPLMSLTTKLQHLHGRLTLSKQLSVNMADLGAGDQGDQRPRSIC